MVFAGLLFAAAAGLAIYAARRVARSADETAERQLRAYVGNEQISLDCPSLNASDFVAVTVRNYGQTPANNVSVHVNWTWGPIAADLPAAFEFEDFPAPVENQRSLFPAQSHESRVAIADAAPFIQAHALQVRLFIYGHVDYTDIYGRNRTTQFCYVYEPRRDVGQRFVAHARHNSAT